MNSKELVERWREHGPATGATLLEIAVSAGMPDDKRVKWCRALQYASTVADRAIDTIATLRAKVSELETQLRGATIMFADTADTIATLRADLAKAKEALEKCLRHEFMDRCPAIQGVVRDEIAELIKELPHD